MYGLFGRVTRRKASLSENNIAGKFRIAKVQLNTRLLQKVAGLGSGGWEAYL